jgi:hypothetical protein
MIFRQFVQCAIVIAMIFHETSSAFQFCSSGELLCQSRYDVAEGVCYNPNRQSCLPLENGENIVCSSGELPCGKQCYKLSGNKMCWAYNTLCDQKQVACIMPDRQKGECYEFFKETCYANVVCSKNQFPCPNDNTKCCAARK